MAFCMRDFTEICHFYEGANLPKMIFNYKICITLISTM